MREKAEEERVDLISPVYLDHETMLDLLATADDGFSLVQQVSNRSENTKSSEYAAESSAATTGLLSSMLKLDLSLGAKRHRGGTDGSETAATRTHTYGSLLARLRRFLLETNQIVTLDSLDDLEGLAAGQFLEVAGTLDSNPFTGVFLQLGRTIEFVSVASALSSLDTTEGSKADRAAASSAAKQQQSSFDGLTKFVHSLAADVERDGVETVLLRSAGLDVTVVATVVTEFLARRRIQELVGREYRLLGKVVRVETENPVDLLGQSGVAGLGTDLLEVLIGAIEQISAGGADGLKRPAPRIEPPVVEVLPIAIFA